jgi:hypothetical protein
MTDKATLHRLINELPESKCIAAEDLLTWLLREDKEALRTLDCLGANPTLYETDFYAWTQAEAAALAAKCWDLLDAAHLVEEIESLGNEQAHAVESHLANLLMHLLKWRYQPARRSRSWRLSIRNARIELRKRLRRSRSLRHELPTILLDAYADARKLAMDDAGLPLNTFPEPCPWNLEQLQDEEFLPDAEEEA